MSDSNKSFYTGGFQDLSKYRLERAEIGFDWDKSVIKSEQGTLFSESCFLESLEAKIMLKLEFPSPFELTSELV